MYCRREEQATVHSYYNAALPSMGPAWTSEHRVSQQKSNRKSHSTAQSIPCWAGRNENSRSGVLKGVAIGETLFQRMEKFQSVQAEILCQILPPRYPGGYRRCFAGNNAGGNRGGRRDGQVNYVLPAQQVRARDTRPGCADIQCFCQFNEFDARGVHTADKDGYLEWEAGGNAALSIQALTFARQFDFHSEPLCIGTCELVRYQSRFYARMGSMNIL